MVTVQSVIPVPLEISETGFIRIVADATKSPPNPHIRWGRWDYLGVAWDNVNQETVGSCKGFEISKEDVRIWLSAS